MSRIPLVLCLAVAGFAFLPWLQASTPGARVHYVGGTGAALVEKTDVVMELSGDDDLILESKGAAMHVPYASINTLEYGQKVERRVAEAILISPLMLLSKRRSYFLTIGYADAAGHQQAMVFRVGSGDVRKLLVGLEARTGRRVEYQDDEARRSGKG